MCWMCSCFLCCYFLDPSLFKQFALSQVSKRYDRLNRNGLGKKHTGSKNTSNK